MRVVMIVQARMNSTRLPGKILKEVQGRPLLSYQIERLRRVTLADDLVIATTVNDQDEQIIAFCQKNNLHYYRGSELDVLARYYEAAVQYQADVIVRITSDCPLIDWHVIDKMITVYLQNQDTVDYVSNCLKRTYPRGMDTEVFSFFALQEAFEQAQQAAEREHVTPFLYKNTDRYRLKNVQDKQDASQYRWTVDTQEDFNLIKEIIENLYGLKKDFTLEDTIQYMKQNPHLYDLNSHIEQKKI